mmetsp:Transcript_38097/g.55941  ORF Transcript_38097/g.55941 Transcript_38097/m.55941 type:complete len:382 (-) Transcript_38097:1029-2174(-)
MENSKSPLLGRPNNNVPNEHHHALWTRWTVSLAVILIVGTVSASLMRQHVSNEVPAYFFAISVFHPFAGLLFYPLIVLFLHQSKLVKMELTTRENLATTLWAMTPVALSFACNNILTMYGMSGQTNGKPDVSTVLALILQKLVVPVSLAIESVYEHRYPLFVEGAGVALVMMGVVVAALTSHENNEKDDVIGHGMHYHAKLLCLLLASVPLATGFLLVKRATRIVPHVSDIELWAVLCVPETIFSIALSYLAQYIHSYDQNLHMTEMTAELYTGLKCIVLGVSPPSSNDSFIPSCQSAAKFNWLSLIPGFAFNITIPVLVRQLEDSTVIPLLRAVALPLASLVAMTKIDPVIATPFSWGGVFAMFFAFVGLLMCYLPQKRS